VVVDFISMVLPEALALVVVVLVAIKQQTQPRVAHPQAVAVVAVETRKLLATAAPA
jgi:hypothetical protein